MPEKPEDVIREFLKDQPYTRDQILGQRRWRELILVRHRLWRELKLRCDLGYTGIGRLMNRDHNTVICGIRSIEKKDALVPDLPLEEHGIRWKKGHPTEPGRYFRNNPVVSHVVRESVVDLHGALMITTDSGLRLVDETPETWWWYGPVPDPPPAARNDFPVSKS